MTILVSMIAPLLLSLALVYRLIYRPWVQREQSAQLAALALATVRVA